MDILFSSDSILVHKQEKDLAMIEEHEPEMYNAVRLITAPSRPRPPRTSH